jgi:hypothetical protein
MMLAMLSNNSTDPTFKDALSKSEKTDSLAVDSEVDSAVVGASAAVVDSLEALEVVEVLEEDEVALVVDMGVVEGDMEAATVEEEVVVAMMLLLSPMLHPILSPTMPCLVENGTRLSMSAM